VKVSTRDRITEKVKIDSQHNDFGIVLRDGEFFWEGVKNPRLDIVFKSK